MPCGRTQRLTVSVNGCLNVRREIGVRNRRIAEVVFVRLRDSDALAQLAPRAFPVAG